MKIFISYRRADSHSNTDRIHEHLAEEFGADKVFQDVLDIDAGHDFREVLREQVTSCDVLLVIIGPQWATIVDADESAETRPARLFNPNDFVRFEVETGLNSPKVLVIPVLVNGAVMPESAQLPDSLQPLRFRNAITIRNNPYFDDDIARLIRQLREHAHEQGIAIRPTRETSRLRVVAAAATAVVLLAIVGVLLIFDPLGMAGIPPTATAVVAPEFISMDSLDIHHIDEEFEAISSETFSEAELEDLLVVEQALWGELPTLDTYGYDVRLVIHNTGKDAVKMALDSRYFVLEDEQGQQANLVYFCCATENTILNPGQKREVRLMFEERENWGGASGKYEGGGIETVFFLRVNGFLPVVRDAWALYVPVMAE